ncbi:hypothetical protein BDA99DRAFT_586753 [Phascolomyces articulosus]|uniref:Uncharacterized protein n=1 Tax=Phascolomyces articulosus TaxID=60185 RepID=A0AAD5PB41_9FUNG|nr:hypothetical protein BDA99DRAFT_586753 [Phascolomyces articulosus]
MNSPSATVTSPITMTSTNKKSLSMSNKQPCPSVMLPSSLSRGRVFLSPIPKTTAYNFKTIHEEGDQKYHQQQQRRERPYTVNTTISNSSSDNNSNSSNNSISKHHDEVEECCLYYYSTVSSSGGTDEEEQDNDTILTRTTSTTATDKDDYTVFSTSPPRSLDTVLSPVTSDSNMSSTVVGSSADITTSTSLDEKILPVSPPLSPPLSPTVSTCRPRFPRWMKQISAPGSSNITMTTSNNSSTIISSPTRNTFSLSPQEMIAPSFTITNNNNSKKSNSSTSLLPKPPSIMRRIMMPPSSSSIHDSRPPLEISHPSPGAHYYGSTHIRDYLHNAMKPNRFDEMLLSGFPAMCPQHDKSEEDDYDKLAYHDNDDYCSSILTEEEDDYDEHIIQNSTVPCLCNHRQMTLRITLTPAHCRATEIEIYGLHSRNSHQQQQQRFYQRGNSNVRGKHSNRLMTTSISTPTPATIRRKHAKEPIPTLSLPPLPRHSSLHQQQPQQQKTAPLYVVTASRSPHQQSITSPTKPSSPSSPTSSAYYNHPYYHHQQPILVLPNGTRRHYLQK